ncbi:MAG: hypothetical protein H6891_09985 [Brucellaceae bacterium]|nr:hypothetical protein [Brucellaceae bacterium]
MIALPVVIEGPASEFPHLDTASTPMRLGTWRSPCGDAAPVTPTRSSMPLLGVDANYRLGNGGSYYDRTLCPAALRNADHRRQPGLLPDAHQPIPALGHRDEEVVLSSGPGQSRSPGDQRVAAMQIPVTSDRDVL